VVIIPGLNLLQLIELFSGLYNQDVDPMELLEMVNLKDKAKAKVKELSGGQKQRFSVATTLINKPRIIFLDEPTTGLDPQARRSLWELVRDIRNAVPRSSSPHIIWMKRNISATGWPLLMPVK
jgi:ABC-2 type transport system ATP-binding protein